MFTLYELMEVEIAIAGLMASSGGDCGDSGKLARSVQLLHNGVQVRVSRQSLRLSPRETLCRRVLHYHPGGHLIRKSSVQALVGRLELPMPAAFLDRPTTLSGEFSQ